MSEEQHQWVWGFKLKSGPYLHGEGRTIEEALAAAGYKQEEVKRYMPVKRLQTEEERRAQAGRPPGLLEGG